MNYRQVTKTFLDVARQYEQDMAVASRYYKEQDLPEYARPNAIVSSSITSYEQMTDLCTAREGVMMDLQTVLLKALAYGYVEKLNQRKPLREAIDLPDEK